jgi:hypothetical protein
MNLPGLEHALPLIESGRSTNELWMLLYTYCGLVLLKNARTFMFWRIFFKMFGPWIS